MFCPKCGSYVADGAKFCKSCGAPLAGGAAQRQVQPASSQPGAVPQAAPAGGRKTLNRKVLVGAVVAVAAVVVVALLVMPRVFGAVGGSSQPNVAAAISGDSNAASKALSGATVRSYSTAVGTEPVYYASDDLADFCESKVDAAGRGAISDYDQLLSLSQDEVKRYDGQWVAAGGSLNLQAGSSSDMFKVADLKSGGANVLGFAQIVAGDELSNQQIADVVAGIGADPEHEVIGSMSRDSLQQVVNSLAQAESGGYTSSYSLDSLGVPSSVQRMGGGEFWSKDSVGIVVAVRCDGYNVVGVALTTPDAVNLSQLFQSEDFQNVLVK